MRFYLGVTDTEWFEALRTLGPEDVNYWQPSGRPLRGLDRGEPFLFKLKVPCMALMSTRVQGDLQLQVSLAREKCEVMFRGNESMPEAIVDEYDSVDSRQGDIGAQKLGSPLLRLEPIRNLARG